MEVIDITVESNKIATKWPGQRIHRKANQISKLLDKLTKRERKDPST